MANRKPDFSGYATKNDIRCSDGVIIRKNAFAGQNGKTVPLVWQHLHDDPANVIGHAVLMNRDDGVYINGYLNGSEKANDVKTLLIHEDVCSLSIYANGLEKSGSDVVHGNIREVSVVLAGANPGACIDNIYLEHSDNPIDGEGIVYTDEPILVHAAEDDFKDECIEHADDERTFDDVIDSMTEDQKDVMYFMTGEAYKLGKSDAGEDADEDKEGDSDMKHNVFDNTEEAQGQVLSHDAMKAIVGDAKKFGSMKESVLEHAASYGIKDIDILFPDAKNYTERPEFIKRETGWVSEVMSGTHHTPFSRIKTMFADITEDAARAKGYIKGKLKKEEVFSLLKRSTTPTTVYKKQKLDRDDVIDIAGFDVISWIKAEMRMMLDEEIARAILIGDGRLASDDDHINDSNIRPILNDADLFVIRWAVAAGSSADDKAKEFIRAAIKSRKNYKGAGTPTLFTTEDMLTDMLLLEDGVGHKLYKTEAELATALRVKKIVTVPVMENLKDKDQKDVYGIIVNLSDYNVGADKGGAVSMFDDFDIDYNQMKYLIETRCSGALVKPFSAIVLRAGTQTKSEEPTLQDAMNPYKPSKQQADDSAA